MPDSTGPVTYLEKLQFAQRVICAARFRTDQKQALREIGEGVYEIVLALLEREEGRSAPPQSEENART